MSWEVLVILVWNDRSKMIDRLSHDDDVLTARHERNYKENKHFSSLFFMLLLIPSLILHGLKHCHAPTYVACEPGLTALISLHIESHILYTL